MSSDDFTGRGLFVFSDPGGAKAVLAMAQILQSRLADCKIISDREFNFYSSFSLKIDRPSLNITDDFNTFKPDFIFTGTSYKSKIELNYLKVSRVFGVASFSFIDHWTFFKKRFEFNGAQLYPDKILVLDKRAKELAIDEGIESAKLEILENPYYEYIRSWKPLQSKAEFLATLGRKSSNGIIVVFAPDPLSNLKGHEAFEFDESQAMEAINMQMKSLEDIIFIIKPHPNQDMHKLSAIDHPNIIIVDSQTDSNLLMHYSDIVVGFFSNFLIEASYMNKKILRYHIKPVKNDPLANLGIGTIVNTKELINELLNYGK